MGESSATGITVKVTIITYLLCNVMTTVCLMSLFSFCLANGWTGRVFNLPPTDNKEEYCPPHNVFQYLKGVCYARLPEYSFITFKYVFY